MHRQNRRTGQIQMQICQSKTKILLYIRLQLLIAKSVTDCEIFSTEEFMTLTLTLELAKVKCK